jgi:hypothetical protein
MLGGLTRQPLHNIYSEIGVRFYLKIELHNAFWGAKEQKKVFSLPKVTLFIVL